MHLHFHGVTAGDMAEVLTRVNREHDQRVSQPGTGGETVGVGARLSRNATMYRPFWVSFDGRRRAERQKLAEDAEWQRIAAMTPEEYARHIGLSEDQVARVRRIAELRGQSPRRTGSMPRPSCDGFRASTAAGIRG